MTNMKSESPSRVLSERSVNTSLPSQSSEVEDTKLANEMLKPKASEVKASQEQTYVSPSDNILSPTSQKLSDIKGKRFANVKSRSLFAKTVSREGLKSQEKFGQQNQQN